MKVFTIEGSIGVGKSTIINGLRKLGFPVFLEPTQEWSSGLKKFYANPTPFEATALQYTILHTIVNRHRRMIRHPELAVIAERSLLSGRDIFVAVNSKNLPHKEWAAVEAEYTKYICLLDQYDRLHGIEHIRIGLDCDFREICQRVERRGDFDTGATKIYHKQIFDQSKAFNNQYCDFIIPVDASYCIKHCIDNVGAIIKGNI